MRTAKAGLKLALELTEKALDGLPIPGVKGSLGGLLTIIKAVEVGIFHSRVIVISDVSGTQTSQANAKTLETLTKYLNELVIDIIRPMLGLEEAELSYTMKADIEVLSQ